MARVPRAKLDRDLALIEAIIVQHPAGLTRPEIEQKLAAVGRPIAWRTLLRRLQLLDAKERIIKDGESVLTCYRPTAALAAAPPVERAPVEAMIGTRLPEPTTTEPSWPGPSKPEEEYVPLSIEGADVRDLVRAPLSARKHVGYNADFLERYEPGHSWYLSEEMRRRLHKMGRTPDAERPAGTYAREIIGHLLIDLSWASSRLEGNKYTRLDTKRLIELGQVAEGKDAKEAQMILNHKKAIELLVEQADLVGFNRYTFSNLHSALAENLVGGERDEGRIRTGLVTITGSNYTPLAIPQRLGELFDLLLTKAGAIPDPFEQAFFVMVQLPYLQPFIDVNKRTSRLGANLPLIKTNLRPLSFVDVPEHAYVEGTLGVYEFNRIELLRDVFLWSYERSCERYRVVRDAIGTPDPIRLRYHALLATIVRETVRGGGMPRAKDLYAWATAHRIAAVDVDAFIGIAERLLLELHEGAIGRYGLRPSEFHAWRDQLELRE